MPNEKDTSFQSIAVSLFEDPFEHLNHIDLPVAPDPTAIGAVEAIENISAELKDALQVNEQEREAIASGLRSASDIEIPLQYASSLTGSVLALEAMLYDYCNNSHLDPHTVWKYICKNKSVSRSSVSVQVKPERILIRLPHLPKRGTGNKSVVNQMLAAALYEEPDLPIWKKWTAAFHHVYPTATSSIPRDVENYDYKKTIDLIAYAIGSSDNPLCFDMSMTTTFSDAMHPGTYIEITPKSSENEEIPSWANLFPQP